MLHAWRTAVRSIARRSSLALTIVVTLALGIGANAAIFSVIDAVLLKPLPFPAADRLVRLYEAPEARPESTSLVAPVRLEEWNRSTRSFDGLAGSYFENMTETSGPLPERLAARRTSPRFFAVFGVPAAIGRTTSPAEETFGGPAVLVISHGFWHERFGGDAAVVGRALTVGGRARTIVGVMPPSFRYPDAETQAWIPAQMHAGLLSARKARFYTAVGRLKAGVTPEAAEADLNAIQRRLGEAFPETDRGWMSGVVALKEEQVGGLRRSLWLLFVAVGLVLFAACSNVACLLLADEARREHELAVRFALGAPRRTIVTQLVREGLVLAGAGALGGLFIAYAAIGLIRTRVTDLLAVDGARPRRPVAGLHVLAGARDDYALRAGAGVESNAEGRGRAAGAWLAQPGRRRPAAPARARRAPDCGGRRAADRCGAAASQFLAPAADRARLRCRRRPGLQDERLMG